MSPPFALIATPVDATSACANETFFQTLANAERATVVTPNRRLAAYLKDQFDIAQRRVGKLAWPTPDILPLATFLERYYRDLNLRGIDCARSHLLSGPQSQLLWEQTVRISDISSYLLSVPQTAKQAAAAWSVAHAWDLLPGMRKCALSEDAEVFLRWAQHFQQLCRELDVIDGAMLPTVLTTWLKKAGSQGSDMAEILPAQLFVVGFDIVTPQQQQFLNACTAHGTQVLPLQSSDTQADSSSTCSRLVFTTDAAELHGCAAWIRQRLLHNPGLHLAIVVPDLRAKRSAVMRALADAMAPGQRAFASPPKAGVIAGFNISLGLALNEYTLVHDALSLIAFSQNRVTPFVEVSAILRSSFIAGATTEIANRARLDAAMREIFSPEITLFSLQRKLKLAREGRLKQSASGCPILLAAMDQVASNVAVKKPSPRDWSRHFANVLHSWGFPGEEALDTTDFQVLEKFREALETLAMLETVQPRMRVEEALSHLRGIVAETVFQPQAEMPHGLRVDVQVLGILESAGQSFDGLWVTGLSEDAWPLISRPNPFIPAILQRAAGVTEASAVTSLALDQRITTGWQNCSREVVFSHAEAVDGSRAGEQKRAASALTRDVPSGDMSKFSGDHAPTDYVRALFALSRREPIPDKAVPLLFKPTKVRGGATVLRDQAACPFRSFAHHRLGARELATPVAGLDALARGTLLHRVLGLVWGRLQSHERLIAMDSSATQALAGEMIDKAILEANATGIDALTGRFAEIEHSRLLRLVTEWLDYEREREPFHVVACEQSREVTLSGLAMQLRLDRLDRLKDGAHALIDYKTGVAKVASWLGERPDEPQLPLYFQTAAETISVLAFARVKRGERRKVFGFEGVSAIDNLLPDVGTIESKSGMEAKGYISWDVLTAEWETSLGTLVENFMAGDAAVDPKNGRLTCAQCDLQSVCRISELMDTQTDDDGTVSDLDADGESADE